MKIEIEKVKKVIKDNEEKFEELVNKTESAIDGYGKVCKLFSCFMGNLYKLFEKEEVQNLLDEEDN